MKKEENIATIIDDINDLTDYVAKGNEEIKEKSKTWEMPKKPSIWQSVKYLWDSYNMRGKDVF
jgi:hypothetical protein